MHTPQKRANPQPLERAEGASTAACCRKKNGERTMEVPENPFGEVILCFIVPNSAPLRQKLRKAKVE